MTKRNIAGLVLGAFLAVGTVSGCATKESSAKRDGGKCGASKTEMPAKCGSAKCGASKPKCGSAK